MCVWDRWDVLQCMCVECTCVCMCVRVHGCACVLSVHVCACVRVCVCAVLHCMRRESYRHPARLPGRPHGAELHHLPAQQPHVLEPYAQPHVCRVNLVSLNSELCSLPLPPARAHTNIQTLRFGLSSLLPTGGVDVHQLAFVCAVLPATWFRSWLNLRHLDLRENKLSVLPDEVSQCSLLEKLLLSDNAIEVIPDRVCVLQCAAMCMHAACCAHMCFYSASITS